MTYWNVFRHISAAYPVAAWTTEPFALLMNRILSPLLLGPVFLKILYPFTVKNGMYWRQENTATVENL